MNRLITTIIFAMILCESGFAQPLIDEALTPAIFNEYGDPLTNIIDPNAARQGDWFYQDIYGVPILLEKYNDHLLLNSFYPFTSENGITDWKKAEEWSLNESMVNELKDVVSNSIGTLQSNQQLVLLFDSSGKLIRFAPIGIWSAEDAKKLENKIRLYLGDNLQNISNETFILL